MDVSAVEEAARIFVEARRTGIPISELPQACRPTHTREVNAITDAVTDILVREDGETIGGWKLGFVFSPRQVPMICPLFDSCLFASPANVPLSLVPQRRIEPEVSFRLVADLPPRQRPYSAPEVAEVVLACPSLEIIDTRFDTRERSMRQMIDNPKTRLEAMADHNTTGAYITAAGEAGWHGLDFSAMRVVMRTPAQVIVESTGGHPFTDPFLPCVVLANCMRHRGGLRAGQLLVTVSFTGFFEVPADEPVIAEFEGLGIAQATFVSGR